MNDDELGPLMAAVRNWVRWGVADEEQGRHDQAVRHEAALLVVRVLDGIGCSKFTRGMTCKEQEPKRPSYWCDLCCDLDDWREKVEA